MGCLFALMAGLFPRLALFNFEGVCVCCSEGAEELVWLGCQKAVDRC